METFSHQTRTLKNQIMGDVGLSSPSRWKIFFKSINLYFLLSMKIKCSRTREFYGFARFFCCEQCNKKRVNHHLDLLRHSFFIFGVTHPLQKSIAKKLIHLRLPLSCFTKSYVMLSN
jgi:hypothetical protein